MPVTINNQTVGFEFADAVTIQPSNFEAITYAVYNFPVEVEVWNMPGGRYQQGDWGAPLLQPPGQSTLSRSGGVRFRVNRPSGGIALAAAASPVFTIAGDYTASLLPGVGFLIKGSTGNDGTYTVSSTSFDGTNTLVTVTTSFPSGVADGKLYPAAQVSVYAWKSDEVVISASVAPAGQLTRAGGFTPFPSNATGLFFNRVNEGDWITVLTDTAPGIRLEAGDPAGNIELEATSGGDVSIESQLGDIDLLADTGDITLNADDDVDLIGGDDIRLIAGAALLGTGAIILEAESSITLHGNGSGALLHVAGAAGDKLGFFGAAPVAKPTGVPVTAVGIHAALVTLGLIAP